MEYSYVAVILCWVMMGSVSAYIAKQRNRNPISWFFIGLLFSFFGLLLLLALPSKTTDDSTKTEDVKVPDIKAAYNEAAAYSDDSIYPHENMPRISRDSTIDWYFVYNRSKIIGPLKLSELRKSLIENKMDSNTYIWCEEYTDWTQINMLQNGASLLDPDFL